MANARTVEEVPISGKTRTKTSIFWSIVPETEQFKNVQVPGVALDRLKDAKKNTQSQKYAQVVQKSKSDSAILNTRSDPVNKQGKTGRKFLVKQNDLSDRNKDASGIIKGASNDQLANMSILSESTKARRASLKNLNVEDKKRVANLIKELAKTGEEREFALERLQEERVSFDEQLSAVQEEQKALKLEREALKQRLDKSEKLLKKYESELKDVKTEKEEQERILKKKFHVQPQSTQTSPLIQNFSTDGTTKSGRFISEQGDIQPRGTKKTLSTQAYIGNSESNDRDGRRQWSKPQVPVYSNSLFDVKVSNVEHSETQSVSEEYQRSNIMENGSLHELYLREYSLQLRLQEQQIEIQRQQVQLQQQLQLLQQQQQQHRPQLTKSHTSQEQQNKEQQQELTQRQEKHNQQHFHQQNQEPHVHHQHRPLEYKEKHSNADHKHQKQIWQKETTQQTRHSREQQPLNQLQNWQQQDPQYPNEQRIEEIFKQSSPTQQTNLLQKRTPERKDQQVQAKQRADTNRTHDHTDHSPRPRHEHHHSVVENSRLQHHEEAFNGQNGEPQKKDRSYTSSGSPSRRYFHHSGQDVVKNRFAVEHQSNRNKGQHGINGTSFETRHMSKGKSPRKTANYAKQIDLNNNDYLQRKSYGRQKNRYDIDDNLVHDHYPQEYLSESYSETDDDVEKHQYNSERPCHCGYYHNQTRRQPVTLDYGQPTSNHSHSRGIPKHGPKSPYGTTGNPYQKGEPHHAQIYQHPHRQRHSSDNSYRQRLLHDPMHIRVPEKISSSGDHLQGEYHHRLDIREEHHAVPHDGPPHYVTHKHEGESEYAVNMNQPTERRTYTRHQLRSPTDILLSPQVGKTEHDNLSSEGLQHSRSQVNRDRSKYLLDDYIYNHRTQDNTKSNAGYEPLDTSSKHSIKRKISRKSHGNMEREENGHPAMVYMTSQQRQYEDENPNPSYSLYKQTVPHLIREQPEYPRTPPGRKHDSHKRYPNSLVEIVEDLEINSEYEERYSEETEIYSTEEHGYDSDEEESTVLDNIFFLKR